MSGAVISSNTTIKISGSVGASLTANGTLFTCPANSYAVVSISAFFSSGGCDFRVDGRTIASIENKGVPNSSAFSGQFYGGTNTIAGQYNIHTGIHIGPSQVLTIANFSGVGTTVVSGVIFINSP